MTLVNEERLAWRAAAARVDAVVVSRSENVRYVADLPDELATALGLRIAVVARCEPFEVIGIVAPRVMAAYIPPDLVAGADVRLYGRFFAQQADVELDDTERSAAALLRSAPGEGLSFEAVLGDAIEALPARVRVACDDPDGDRIAAERGHPPSGDGERLLRDVRQVKTGAEIERLQDAARIAELIEGDIFDAVVVGADWESIAQRVPAIAAGHGGRFGYLSGGAGRQGGFMFPPRRLSLVPGHLVRLDLGVSSGGYWSDTGRSASVGPATADATSRYRSIKAGADAALERLRPGVTFESLYQTAMAVIRRDVPAYRRHHTGHAIGMRAYDGPLVAEGDATRVEAGMVLNIEVPLYEIGWGGLQLEDTLVVEDDGFRSLTLLDRELRVLPI
jgi:Xaa-Pro aminopeptidase